MDDRLQGILAVDKPIGLTSARVVSRIKRLLPRKTKVGHAGTLDPFASGLLLVLVGPATKACESLMDQPKQYDATVKLGATTATDDPESPEQPVSGATEVSPEAIARTLVRFIGRIEQRPPVYSALRVAGQRAYALARSGETVDLPPRTVHVYGIDLLDYHWPLLRLRIDCGRGTYIRAIARDVGAELGVGGHLVALRRTRIGRFHVEHAAALTELEQRSLSGLLQPVVQSGNGDLSHASE